MKGGSVVFDFLYKVLCGFFLGLSVFAPGLSGSVIAIIMGIYKRLVDIAANPLKDIKRTILFCIPLVIGATLSAVVFILAFDYLFNTYEKATYLLFIGLIAGNLPVIYDKIKEHVFKPVYLVGGAFAFVIALVLLFAANGIGEGGTVTALTAGLPLLASAGFAGGATPLIPGMSVSMVLIVFGVYRQLIFAAKQILALDLSYVIPFVLFALSAIAGLIISSKGIKWVFEKIPGLAYTIVFGFMASSVTGLVVQSLQLRDAEFNWLLGAVMLGIGLLISMGFVALSHRMDPEKLQEADQIPLL